ncbi:hypothetical protein Tco_0526095 [Tanacetum coccineum]
MLDKDLYDSWKSRMELYMQNREHKIMILESIEHGPLIWPTIEENGVTRTKKYTKLSAVEKIQADCDTKATNIILQGQPADIYSLVNHHRVSKDLWKRVQLLMQDLHTTNFDQLHAYLEQHKLHANEVRLLHERNQDPLAFVANLQMTPPHFNTYQSSYNNPQLQQQFPQSQYGSIHPTQHYSSTYLSQPQFNHSSVPPSYPYQSQMNRFDVRVFSLGDDLIAYLNMAMAFLTAVASSSYKSNATSFRGTMQMARQGLLNATTVKDKAMLAEAQEAGQILDEEQLVFLADLGVPDGQAVQTIIPNNDAFQTKDLDTYDSNCDDISNAKAVLMANISNYGSDVISEVPHSETYLNDIENQSVHAMQDFEQLPVVDFTDNEIHSTTRFNDLICHEKMIDSQMDDMIKEKLALKEQVDSLEQNISKQIKEKECLLQTFTVFKNESKEKQNKYMENEIDLEKKIKELDNIIFNMGQSAPTMHMLTKPQALYDNIHKQALGYQNPFYLKKAQWIKPTLYDGIVISAKHVAMPFDSVVKKRTTPDARIEGEWGFEHTEAIFNNDIIPFLKILKDIFNVFDKDLLNEIIEVQTVFDQMEAVVQQSSVDKQCLKIAKKELLLENDGLLQQIMSQDVLLTVMNSMSLNGEYVNMEMQRNGSCDKCFNLDAELSKS